MARVGQPRLSLNAIQELDGLSRGEPTHLFEASRQHQGHLGSVHVGKSILSRKDLIDDYQLPAGAAGWTPVPSLRVTVLGFPQPYRDRSCQGQHWKCAFPGAPNEEIREFLHLVSDAFAFPRRHRLQLHPDDCVLGIYQAIYARWELADSMELETLADNLDDRYDISLELVWSESLTLGDLFEITRFRAELGD